MRRIIIIENSGKENIGGEQKITVLVAVQLLNEMCRDFSYIFVICRSFFFPFKYLNWLLDLVVLTCFFPGNLGKIKYHVTKQTLIYVTTKKGLLYAYMMKVIYGVPFIYHAHLVENTKSIFYF